MLNADIAAAAGFAADFFGKGMSWPRRVSILLMPGVTCCAIHRLAHWAWRRQWRTLARFIARFNYMLHKADLSPAASIGPGLYIPHTVGVVFHGHAGTSLTLYAKCSVSPARFQPCLATRLEDAPRIGNGVTVGALSVVRGAITLGNDVRIGPDIVVTSNIEPGTTLFARTRSAVSQPSENSDFSEIAAHHKAGTT
jgi:serine O-acetyltransferase